MPDFKPPSLLEVNVPWQSVSIGDVHFCGCHGKTRDSINVQYVTDKCGHIRHVFTGRSGSTHDITVVLASV